jgi:hypothetical protein
MSEVKRPLTLKWILGKQDRRVWNGHIWLAAVNTAMNPLVP